MMESVTEEITAGQAVARKRFAAQLLLGSPATSPEQVAERLLAIQGQDPRGARLAIRARTRGLTAADVDRALTGDRSLVLTWLNRGTLHLVRTEDYWWLHRLTMRPSLQVSVRRMLARGGIDDAGAEKGVSVVESALLTHGPLTGSQLRSIIAAAGLPAQDNMPLHIIALASMRGSVVRGPMAGAQHAYVHVRDWLGAPPAVDPDLALAELARRYLAGHGPASDRDLAKWAGLPLGEARRALRAVAAGLRDRPDGQAELASKPDCPAQHEPGGVRSGPRPRLLGAYDPLLLGWASRTEILDGHQDLVTVNGLFRPFALVDGRAAGTWSWTNGRVVLNRFAELSSSAESALAAEARDVKRFLTGSVAAGEPRDASRSSRPTRT